MTPSWSCNTFVISKRRIGGKIKRLKAVIAGKDGEEVQEDEERWPAMSPRPRRISYGSIRYRTRINWP
jgi:hypothetical protein